MPSASKALTPDPALVERFRRDLSRLIPDGRIGLAVSGGGDSLAMLLLAQAACPGRIAAATVDHGLRAEAAAEADMVAQLCQALNVPHEVLRAPDRREAAEPNIQAWAREVRYGCLADWAGRLSLGAVAVAHQADDVAENLLMRARRGAGLRGLARMAEARPIFGGAQVKLVRPLLQWRRDTLAAIVRDAGLKVVDDPSNSDDRFDRSRIRAILRDHADLDVERLAKTATQLRDAEEAIDWIVRRELPQRLTDGEPGQFWLDASDLPYELRRRLVVIAVKRVRASSGLSDRWREDGIDRLLASLDAGRGGTLAGVQGRAYKKVWLFNAEPPRRS